LTQPEKVWTLSKRPSQVDDNLQAAETALLSEETMTEIRSVHNHNLHKAIHHFWLPIQLRDWKPIPPELPYRVH
jgi:hypothetical protein